MDTAEMDPELDALEREVEILAAQVDCFTARQVSRLAGITPGTLETQVKRNTAPPSVLYGNRRLFPRAQLRQWLDGRLAERVSRASTL